MAIKSEIEEFTRTYFTIIGKRGVTELQELFRKAQSEAWERAHDCVYVADGMHEEFCGNPFEVVSGL